MDADKKHVYITVNGREVEYQAISLDTLRLSWLGIEKKHRASGEPLDPPTYEVVTASRAKMQEPHDDTTEKTPEEQIAWNAYKNAIDNLWIEKEQMRMKYIYEDSLGAIQLPEDNTWMEKHKSRLVEIPEEPDKLREFYITSEILKSNADIAGIVSSVMLLSQQGKVEEASLEAAMDSFLGYVGRKAIKRAIDRQKQVEAQPATV
jgi:hypothetical protein